MLNHALNCLFHRAVTQRYYIIVAGVFQVFDCIAPVCYAAKKSFEENEL